VVCRFEEATRHLFYAVGLTPAFMRENNRGMAAVEQQIVYKRELLAATISIHSPVLEIKDKVLRFCHEMRKADTSEVAATTVLTGVHLDKAARRACALSHSVRDKATALIFTAR
jgi:acyl-CoA thioester hydrolase